MPVKKISQTRTGATGFSSAGSGIPSAPGGFSLASPAAAAPTVAGFGFGAAPAGAGLKTTSGFSMMQAPGDTVGVGGAAAMLTPKCGIVDVDEIRQAYAPVLSVADHNHPCPTVEYMEPGGAKQANKSCELYCWLYSPINPNQRGVFNNHDIQRREADKRNPDPTNLESEKIIGTANLKRRFDRQQVASAQLQRELVKVRGALAVVERSARKDSDRVGELERDQARLYHKYLTVLRKVELLRCHGCPITLHEQRCREQLAKIVHAMQTPNLKIQELLIIQSQIDRSFQDVYADDLHPREVERLCSALDKQREGLQFLTDILKKDARDMDIIRKNISQQSSARGGQGRGR